MGLILLPGIKILLEKKINSTRVLFILSSLSLGVTSASLGFLLLSSTPELALKTIRLFLSSSFITMALITSFSLVFGKRKLSKKQSLYIPVIIIAGFV
jgi:hypothetical protein